ncbi:MAG: hypothetical protein K1X86_00020 [Ignavibacteria bacterium]|nr:hypothetical protein [Ignavibacteria bacterium]
MKNRISKKRQFTDYLIVIYNISKYDIPDIIISEKNPDNPPVPHASEPIKISSGIPMGRVLDNVIEYIKFPDNNYIGKGKINPQEFYYNTRKFYAYFYEGILTKKKSSGFPWKDKYYATLIVQDDSNKRIPRQK